MDKMALNVKALFQTGTVVFFNNKIYYYAVLYYMIVFIDLRTGIMDFIPIPDKYLRNRYSRFPFFSVAKSGHYLFLLPNDAFTNIICVYDFLTGAFSEIALPSRKIETRKPLKLYNAIPIGDILILYGGSSEVFKYDTRTNALSYIDGWDKWDGKYEKSTSREIEFGIRGFCWNDRVYLASINRGGLLEIEEGGSFSRFISVDKEELMGASFGFIGIRKDSCWLSSWKKNQSVKFIHINLTNDDANIFTYNNSPVGERCWPIGYVEGNRDKIYCLPGNQEQGYVFDMATKTLNEWDIPSMNLQAAKREWAFDYNYFTGIKVGKKNIISIYQHKPSLIDIDIETGEMREIIVEIDCEKVIHHLKSVLLSRKYIREDSAFNLDSFLRIM